MDATQSVVEKPLRRGGTWIQRWRVPLGFLAAIIFMLLAQPHPSTLVVGGAISLLGLAIRAWAAGHIRKNSELAITGPYAFSRNPLYLGSLILGLGFTIAAGRWELAILFVLLFIGIYFPVMRVESKTLDQIFGENYRRYAREVPLFFPHFRAYKGLRENDSRFDGSLYMRYREYRATLGFLIAWGLLALKSYYLV